MNSPKVDPMRWLLMLIGIGSGLISASAVIALLTTFELIENRYALAKDLFSGGIFLFLLVVVVVSAIVVAEDKQRRKNLPPTPRDESSAFRKAQDEYNTEAWNTSDFSEPPAIGGKREC